MDPKIKTVKKYSLSKKTFSKFPQVPGVYFFWQGNIPVYIGKSVNIKQRLLSYLSLKVPVKTEKMLHVADHVSFIKVNSELESLLLEAKLIHQYSPKYNIQAKDDKNPLYIKISNDKYPKITTARKIDTTGLNRNQTFFGPFPNSTEVKRVLRLIRRIFPYSDHKIGPKPCFYSHLGLCNPCPNLIEKINNISDQKKELKNYLLNIKNINKLLSGNITKLKRGLTCDMDKFSKLEYFEKAQEIKNQITALEYVTQKPLKPELFIENPNYRYDLALKQSTKLLNYLKLANPLYKSIQKLVTIECYDISHLSGKAVVASLVTFKSAEEQKKLYKKFKLTFEKNNDVLAMSEIAKRRKNHLKDWGKPDLILVDGGKGQVSQFYKVFKNICPVVGFAKNSQTLIIPKNDNSFLTIRLSSGSFLNFFTKMINEAHRFAQSYHHTLIKKSFLDKKTDKINTDIKKPN